MKKKIITVMGYTILFIEALLLFSITILGVLKFTIFNDSYLKKELVKNNYYEELSDEIKTEMSYYTNQSGFEDEILENIFTIGEVKYETNKFIENVYNGKKRIIDTSKLEDRLNKNIDNYLKENEFQKIEQKELDDFVKAMSDVYTEEIKLMGYAEKIAPLFYKLINYCDKLLIVLIVLLVLLLLVNHLLIKNKEIGVVLFTSTFIMIFSMFYIKNNIDISHIFVYSKLMSNVIKSMINGVFLIMRVIIILYMVLGMLIAICIKTKKSK